jgi:nicotinate-nucleotide pyrophosphorylase (carboxylating)
VITLPDAVVEPIVRIALLEDIGRGGDVTASLVAADDTLEAWVSNRNPGTIAGLQAARIACHLVDPAIRFEALVQDGAGVEARTRVARVSGPARAILTAERTALNFLTMMSGVATLTAEHVRAVAGTSAKIAATRKTLPGLRVLQKQAVTLGGGLPHRFGLDDAILIKDNHVAACGSIGAALERARSLAGPMRVVEIEVDGLEQLREALPFEPDVVMLDNFDLAKLREGVAIVKDFKGRVPLVEASGGVNLSTVADIAKTGVDIISVGALTHSAPALDIGLDA